MPDLPRQIRERLDGWAPPGAWLEAFRDAEAPTPTEVSAFAEELSAAIAEGKFAGPVCILPPSPKFYPGFEQMRAALLAVLDAVGPRSHLTPSMRDRVHVAVAKALGIEVDDG